MRAFCHDRCDDIDFVFYHTTPDARDALGRRCRVLRPHFPIVRIPLSTPWALWRDGIDLAHFQYFAPPVCPCPFVLTVHDLSFERHPEFFRRAMAMGMRTLVPLQTRRAAAVIAVSEATKRDLVELYHLDPECVAVVHNGVSEDMRHPADIDEQRRAMAALGLKERFVLCVGNLSERKNQHRVVRAFDRWIAGRDPGIDLVLVGQITATGGKVRAAVRDAKHAGSVKCVGFVDRSTLRALYSAATVSVYVSLYEGFGLPIVESMACGTPVVASSVSCMPEIAGGAALLVDPLDEDEIGSALKTLIESPPARAELARKGKARAAAFSWEDAARKTAQVYRSVMDGARAGG